MAEQFTDGRGNHLHDLVFASKGEETFVSPMLTTNLQAETFPKLYADANATPSPVVPMFSTPLKKDEALASLQTDLNLPADAAAKAQFALVRNFMDKPLLACDVRPQSPWVTGKPVADDCGINLKSIYAKVKDAVTQAVVPQPDGTTDWGAAFKYCDDKSKKCVYITNAHVVEDADQAGLVAADGKTVQYGRVLVKDLVHDVAIIDVPYGDKRPSIKIGPDPQVGDPVFTIGHPYGVPGAVVSAGNVLELNYSITDVSTNQSYYGMNLASIYATPGNSGGPQFDKKGRVVGIVSDASANYTSASMPISVAINLLKNIP